ncbi:MAG: sigma-70 family RNA polymerase sigma factor [Muribaculaceae bacterium]|nr:sigma-70 family RNA polymerase sigma factor [Muribaculaceae bacterium]
MEKSEKAFTRLVREYEQTIYSICYMYSQTEADAKDLMQETLINIWTGLDRFRGESSLRTWVTRITINTCISSKRKKKIDTVGESFIPPLASAEAGAQIRHLHHRLCRLDYLDRALILLWLEDMSYDEIGAIIGLQAKNVGVRLLRIKDKLKKMNDEQ